jgi:hypothetical protein
VLRSRPDLLRARSLLPAVLQEALLPAPVDELLPEAGNPLREA